MKIKVPKETKQYWDKKYDEQSVRVYTAAHYGGAIHDAYFKTREEVKIFINQVRKSKLWLHTWHPETVPLISFYTKSSHAEAWGGFKLSRGKVRPFLKLPDNPFGRSVSVILHELAHCIVMTGGHGRDFCYTYLSLTAEFQGIAFAEALEQRFYETGALKRRPRRRKK